MTVLIAHQPGAASAAALAEGYEEARRREETDVVVFLLDGPEPDVSAGTELGLTVTFERPDARDKDAAGALLVAASRLEVSVIVIGVKHRTATGKLLFGSTAQRILLDAAAPVLAVKAGH